MRARAGLGAALALLVLTACASPAPAAKAPCALGPADERMQCTMQYDPVCGCDGVTRGNACVARAHGVPEWTPGACEDASDPR